ncbi:hypothetical protein [Diplocloster hominis]|uniref:hypothetical protein n=1 Tax=Diplocloster hominis TaxID=3079010 RepID=UPI0031BB4567
MRKLDRVYSVIIIGCEYLDKYITSLNGETHLKVLSVAKIFGDKANKMEWEEKLGTEDDPCRWIIGFKDKTLVIEDGRLAEERNK